MPLCHAAQHITRAKHPGPVATIVRPACGPHVGLERRFSASFTKQVNPQQFGSHPDVRLGIEYRFAAAERFKALGMHPRMNLHQALGPSHALRERIER